MTNDSSAPIPKIEDKITLKVELALKFAPISRSPNNLKNLINAPA